MDFNDNEISNNDILEWQGEEFSLQLDSRNDISSCIWDDMYTNEENLLSIFEEQTPLKDCFDYNIPLNDVLDYSDKVVEACPETLQIKRRRMLQFTSDSSEFEIDNVQFNSTFLEEKLAKDSCMENGMSTYSECNTECNASSKDGRHNSNLKELDHSNLEETDHELTENLLVNCVKESEMRCSLNEMDDFMAIDDQALVEEDQNAPEDQNVPYEMKTEVPRRTPSPSPVKIIKGGKLTIKPSKKLVAPLMCPFALVKPCGVKGDTTLKDINQKIQSPQPSSSELKIEDSSSSYPTSAFSGKPVVLKTKIRTLGGKGSITIMRTKG